MATKRPDEILTILAHDARTPIAQIAKMTGQSPDAVESAVHSYEQQGVIKRYKTIVDWEKAGVEKVIAFIDVKVTPARDVGFDAVARRIYGYAEVKSVWLVSGGSDLKVVVEGENIRQVGEFVAERLATINGVTGTQTHFLLKKYKEDGDVFVDSDEDNRLVVTP